MSFLVKPKIIRLNLNSSKFAHIYENEGNLEHYREIHPILVIHHHVSFTNSKQENV